MALGPSSTTKVEMARSLNTGAVFTNNTVLGALSGNTGVVFLMNTGGGGID
jgi:hypothetical protein